MKRSEDFGTNIARKTYKMIELFYEKMRKKQEKQQVLALQL